MGIGVKSAALLSGWIAIIFCAIAAAEIDPVDLCPSTQTGEEWSAECFTGKDAERKVRPEYLRNIDPNHYGMAVITISSPLEVVAVNREGMVVIPDIQHTGDFDFPDAEGGIGRFSLNVSGDSNSPVFKCGYFKAGRFSVVAPAVYDQCSAMRRGEAKACIGCVSYCTDEDCHNRVFVGGMGVVLAPDGGIVWTDKIPDIDLICGGEVAEVIDRGSGYAKLLKCSRSESGFSM